MGIPRILFLAGAVVTFGRGLAVADVKVVVVEKNRVQLPEPLDRTDLLEEVGKEMTARGCPVADSCRSAECQSKAIVAGATDVLDVDAEYRREQYSCSVTMELRSSTGAVRFSSRFANEACPAMDLVEHAKELAARACEQLHETKPEPSLASAPPAATVETRAGPAVPRGYLIGGGGAVLAALGAVVWILDGQCAHSASLPGEAGCRDRYSTKAIGIPLTVVGVGAMAVGGWMVWRDHRAAVALNPGGVTVTGRF
jgi:hypothetical protein